MSNEQGIPVPVVVPQNGERRPLGGGPVTPLGVHQSPPPMYAAPVPPVQPPQAQAPQAPAATPPATPPPWAKAPAPPAPLDPTLKMNVLEGVRAGVTAEEILAFYGQHVTYEQLAQVAGEAGLTLARQQTVPALPQASADASGGAEPRRDRIVRDKHYPLIATNYLAEGKRDVALIARELNVTEKAVEKAIVAIDKEPSKWGLAPAVDEPPAVSHLTEMAQGAAKLPVEPKTAEQLAFEQWVPEEGQTIPGERNVLPAQPIRDKIRACKLDITWDDAQQAWRLIPAPQSSFASPPRETTTEKPVEPSASPFGTDAPASIQRALAVLADVHELAKRKGYSYDEIEAAGTMLASQG